MATSSNDRRRGSQPVARKNAPASWQADQIIAILRQRGAPMNSTEIAGQVPYLHALECRDHRGDGPCFSPDIGFPLADSVVHLHTRGHTTSSHTSELLRRLQTIGVVTRAKVDRRVMWSLAPSYVESAREIATRAAAVLMDTALEDASPAALKAVREVNGSVDVAFLTAADLRTLVDNKVEALSARGVIVELTSEPHRAENDDRDWTASVDYRSNGPLRTTVVSLWDGAEVERQARALGVALRRVDDPATRERFPDGFVIR